MQNVCQRKVLPSGHFGNPRGFSSIHYQDTSRHLMHLRSKQLGRVKRKAKGKTEPRSLKRIMKPSCAALTRSPREIHPITILNSSPIFILVGGWATPLKNMKVVGICWDYIIPNMLKTKTWQPNHQAVQVGCQPCPSLVGYWHWVNHGESHILLGTVLEPTSDSSSAAIDESVRPSGVLFFFNVVNPTATHIPT